MGGDSSARHPSAVLQCCSDAAAGLCRVTMSVAAYYISLHTAYYSIARGLITGRLSTLRPINPFQANLVTIDSAGDISYDMIF